MFDEVIEALSDSLDPENPEALNEAIAAIDPATLPEVREQLAAVIRELYATFKAGAGSEQELDAMREAKALLSAIDESLAATEAARAEMAKEAEDLADGVESPDEEEEDEAEAEAVEDAAAEDETVEEEAVTASIQARSRALRPGALKDLRPKSQAPQSQSLQPLLAAAGDVADYTPGHVFADQYQLADAMTKMARHIRGGKDRRRYTVARLEVSHGQSLGADAQENYNTLRDIQKMFDKDPTLDPILAAGGFCGPETTLYGFFDISAEDGLLVLPGLDAPRGKVSIPDSPSLDEIFATADWDGSIAAEWTEEDDIAVDPDDDSTWKTCFFVPCGVSSSFQVAAAVTCLEYGNFVSKFWPEMVADTSAKSLKAHTHKVNAAILAAVQALAVAETAVDLGDHGTIITLLHNLEFFAQEYRDKYRMALGAPLEVILPAWVQGALYNDAIARSSTTTFERTMAFFDSVLSARGLRTQFVQDWQGIVGENDYPATVDALMYAPGTVARLDEGSLDFGVTRDTISNRKNTFQQFVETFQGVAKVGHEVREISNIQVYPTGETGSESGIAVPAS